MTKLNTAIMLLAMCLAVDLEAESSPTPDIPASGSAIEQDGVSFFLANSTRTDTSSTEEYYVKGETPNSWTQTLTFQRVNLPSPTPVDLFVAGFKKKLETQSTRLRIVQQNRDSAVFGVHYPSTTSGGEQVVLVFVARPDSKKLSELQITQYAVNPAKMEIPKMEMQMKRWQARFQAQAAALK